MAVSNPESFHLEARFQRACAVCGATGEFDAHHVVERQELRRRGLPEWDTRNALRLCQILGAVGGNCHSGQSTGLRRVRLDQLRDENLEYAFEALGAFAYFYLRRRYVGEDSRVEAAYMQASAEEVAFP